MWAAPSAAPRLRGWLIVPTLGDLIEETTAHLNAFTEHTEQSATLTADVSVTTGGITMSVDDASLLSRGYVEIGQELLYVSSVDMTVSTATVPAWGRGQQGSTAATHATGSRVIRSPRWPRNRVKRVLNEVLASVYPKLFVVKVDESNTSNPSLLAYPLPADCRRVMSMAWSYSGFVDYWLDLRTWRVDMSADTSQFPTGKSVAILEPMEPGRTIKIQYEAAPTVLVNESDDFAGVSGLSDSASDLVCLGAAARLAVGSEIARTQPNTVEQSERASIVQGGTTLNASKYLYGLFQQRLEEERDRLLELYPPTRERNW
jgi:hypothetical protein